MLFPAVFFCLSILKGKRLTKTTDMRKLFIPVNPKLLLLIVLCASSMFGHGQNAQLNIISVFRTAYLEAYQNKIENEPGLFENDVMSSMPVPTATGIMILFVSPDPCEGDFKVKIATAQKIGISIRVFNTSGKLLRRMAAKRNEAVFFGNDLRPGNYIMEVIQGNTRKIQKLVKY